jgi:hypothetical protein
MTGLLCAASHRRDVKENPLARVFSAEFYLSGWLESSAKLLAEYRTDAAGSELDSEVPADLFE